MSLTTDVFWEASKAIYSSPVTSRLCLELQDGKIGFNVNLLLLAIEAGRRGYEVRADGFNRALAAIKDWQALFLRPLRDLRRRAKPYDALFYQSLKSAELSAERAEQKLLLDAMASHLLPLASASIEGNLNNYALCLGSNEDRDIMASLQRLAQSVA